MTWRFANQGRRFQIWHFRLEILTPWPHYPQNSQILLYKYCFFAWNTPLPSSRRHTCTCATKFLHHLGTGCCLPKTTFRTKIWGGCATGASKKLGTLYVYVFLQPLKLATPNLVHNLGLGLAYQKTMFKTKIGGGLGQASIRKNLGPPIYFCNRLKNWYATGLPCQNWRGSGPGEHPKKIWDPRRIFATVEASNYKFGTQIGFGTSLPENNVLDQNWRGLGQGSVQKNLGPPTYFCNRWSQQLQIWYTTRLWD